MTSRLFALSIDANDPTSLARFWAGVLGWEMAESAPDEIALLPSDDTGFRIRFLASEQQKTSQNQIHFDLTSRSVQSQRETIATVLGLGAEPIDIGQEPDEKGEEHRVFADPEGNEFCVIQPGNSFLADCGFIGALSCDGTQEVGYFWSAALGWPLVWDQDEETAIRSPYGGPKVSWGGRPVNPKTGRNRLHFDLMPPVHGDQQGEVERLVTLGATLDDIDVGHEGVSATRISRCGVGAVAMADVDGNEFCVLTPR